MGSSLRTDLQTVLACLSRARRRELGLLMLLMPTTALAETLTVAAIVPFIALLSDQPARVPLTPLLESLSRPGTGPSLWTAAMMFGVVVVVTAALRLALSWLSRHFAFALGHEVTVEIQRRLLDQPYAYHLRRHSSEYLAALDKVDMLVFDFVIQGVQALSALLIGACILALLIAIDPVNASVAVLLIGGFYGISLIATRKRLQHHGATINRAYEQRTKFVQESIGGLRDLILDRSQDAALDRFRAIDFAFARARTKTAFLAAAPRFLIEAAGLMIIALLAIMIADRDGGIATALPFLGALALGALRLLPLASQLYGASANLAVAGPILTDVAGLLRLPLDEDRKAPDPIQFERSIELDAICFNYADRTHRAIEEVSLVIPKGARVAVTGRTGSGKSTLADLLMGLIEPGQGSILVDGVRLSADRLPGWRRSVAHVPQEIFLADDSIAANISLSFHGVEPDFDRIRSAAKRAQLDQFIDALPDGYDTRIGERGVRMSGGQRQRLALARAIYKQAPVLVLDEPTSALDHHTEAAIINTLDELQSQGVTIIIVAHRLSTMAQCNPLFALEDGRLVRSGSFAELFVELRRLETAIDH